VNPLSLEKDIHSHLIRQGRTQSTVLMRQLLYCSNLLYIVLEPRTCQWLAAKMLLHPSRQNWKTVLREREGADGGPRIVSISELGREGA
jgi:hypothetical protein